MFFDDESAEVVISSLRLGEEQDRYFNIICTYFQFNVEDILPSMFCSVTLSSGATYVSSLVENMGKGFP